ncbi:MAG: ABC transporter permease [Gemella haemolysans]|uniref:ABC transporter permease n=1 Tax=Gemella haemolysans TaxID=1379 RepID=UPI002914B4B7|nr:ABC transporter permease [Gemella haemolysans]MDU6573630.1 ABC transporter permease [Gemella haemolysans]
MLSLIKIEINKVSKSKLFLAWFATILIVLGVTGIIIMGLGTDNKLGEFVGQSSNNFRIADKWGNWAIATSLFSALFTKAAFLIFEAYLLSTIFIDEFKQRTIFQLFSYPISKIKLLWGKVISVIVISFIAHFTAHLVIQLLIKLVAVLTESDYIPVVNQLINLVGISFGTVLIGVLPFVIGMIKYSTPITMLSGLGLAALLSNATPGSLTNNFVDSSLFLIFASFISIIIASVSIYNISRKDINIE